MADMKDILSQTAWRMTTPLPFQGLHLLLLVVGLTVCIALAYRLRHLSSKKRQWLLFGIGCLLLLLELYKQLFHFYLLDQKQYDWWILPFQLCSLPMYLYVLLPFLRDTHRRRIETFLMDFTLLGALMALLFPYDLMHGYVTLTIHAFLWHFLLLFGSLLLGFSHSGQCDKKGFYRTLPIFFFFVGVATVLNVALHTYGEINMFYISPYYESMQPIFKELTPLIGLQARNLVYIVSMIVAAWLLHQTWAWIQKKTR